MHDVNHALANLRQSTNMPALDFDANGNLSLVFDGETTVNFARTGDKTIELWAAAESAGSTREAADLRRALEANHFGEGTGGARLAVSGDDSFVLCRTLDVSLLDDRQFADAVVDFLKYATFWNSAEGRSAGASRSGGEQPAYGVESFVIRG